MSDWLKKYYGSAFDKLNPSVYLDGDKSAVVKITIATSKTGSSRVGYVLIKKSGSHNVTPQVSLHEGVPTQKDHDRMKKALKNSDGVSG